MQEYKKESIEVDMIEAGLIRDCLKDGFVITPDWVIDLINKFDEIYERLEDERVPTL